MIATKAQRYQDYFNAETQSTLRKSNRSPGAEVLTFSKKENRFSLRSSHLSVSALRVLKGLLGVLVLGGQRTI